MKTILPTSWIQVKLGDVTSKPQYGWTSKASTSGRVKYLRTTDLSNGKVDWSSVPFCLDEPKDINSFQLFHNDIVVSRAGSIGLSYRIDNPPINSVFASYLIRFRPVIIDVRIIEHFLKSDQYWKIINEVASGIAMQNINATKISEIDFPLAPLNEQKRIADKLDSFYNHLDIAKKKLDNIPELIRRLKQSILKQAISGKLTEEWRNNNTVSETGTEFTKRVISEFYKTKTKGKLAYKKIEPLYSIPKTWCFSNLQNFGEVTRGKSKHRPRNDSRL